jgi:hypothetical protein
LGGGGPVGGICNRRCPLLAVSAVAVDTVGRLRAVGGRCRGSLRGAGRSSHSGGGGQAANLVGRDGRASAGRRKASEQCPAGGLLCCEGVERCCVGGCGGRESGSSGVVIKQLGQRVAVNFRGTALHSA